MPTITPLIRLLVLQYECRKQVKAMEKADVLTSAEPVLPNIVHLTRTLNRFRQTLHPDEPRDLDFLIDEEHIPEDFQRADITIGIKRHLVFATERMLDLLSNAKRWYLNGTFYVVRKPFTQLFSIHAFVMSGGNTKQVPLVFVLMSGKFKADYVAVLEHVRDMLPSPPALRGALLDFVRVEVMGCCISPE